MSNIEMNRQIVQEGLNRKKTERKQRMTDAAHDAAERQLRVTINQHAQEREIARDADIAKRLHDEEIQRKKKEDKVRETREVRRLLRFVGRIATCLLYAALVTIAFTYGFLNFGVTIAAISMALISCTVIFVKYTRRMMREKEKAYG